MKFQNIIKITSALAVIATIAAPTDSLAQSIGEDPIMAYGDKIIFDVFRKDSLIGTHEMTFSRDDEDIIAKTRFEVSIKILIIPIYSYLYTSKERWRDGKLISLSAETNDNGDLSNLKVTRQNGALSLAGSGGEYIASGDLYPTTHWNSGTIGSTKVINTITGKINDVEMQNLGVKTVTTEHGEIQATHFAYQGDLATEVWYDSAGKWVKMQFPGKDGVMIEYKCRVCGPHPVKTGVLPGEETLLPLVADVIKKENEQHVR